MSRKLAHPEKALANLTFENREKNKRHHYYDEEMKQYQLMQAGDLSGVEESHRMMVGNLNGKLSEDPVRNMKYLFVANITITNRFAIEGGLDSETAYNIADLYIRRMDLCQTVEEVLELHREMFTFFTEKMAGLRKTEVYARPVVHCIDYIDLHLHEPLRVAVLADVVGLNPSYLSVLFKKETGQAISDYILDRRIAAAKTMLLDDAYQEAEISTFLAFSSQSYFIKCFKQKTGMTPHAFRNAHFRRRLDAADTQDTSAPHKDQ